MKRIALIAATALVAAACGGSSGTAGSPPSTPPATTAAAGDAGAPGTTATGATGGSPAGVPGGEVSLDAGTFVLCPVITANADELAAIVGMTIDPERGTEETSSNECNIRGLEASFVRVQIGSSFDGTVEPYVESIDSDGLIVSKAIEVSRDAVYATDGYQPHVVFSLGDRLVIDVNAEVEQPDLARDPGYDPMIALATRVRELLIEANSP